MQEKFNPRAACAAPVVPAFVAAGRGNEPNFASAAEVVAQFDKLAIHALPKAQVGELRDAMPGLDALADAGRIGELRALR